MEDYHQALAEHYGIQDPPEIEVIREMHPDDQIDAFAGCMQEKGWPYEQNSEGQWSVQDPGDQEEAFNLDSFVCDAQYPTAPRYRQGWTDVQTEAFYRFLVDEYVPCVEAEGYEVSEPPTLETFREGGPETWMPSTEVGSQATASEFLRMQGVCDPQMDVDDLYPELTTAP